MTYKPAGKLMTRHLTLPVLITVMAHCINPQVLHASAVAPEVRTVALSGEQAPGTPAGLTFGSYKSLYFSINDVGQVAFIGYLQGPDAGGFSNGGIWSEGFGSLALVARGTSQPPDVPDYVRYDQMLFLVLNAPGQVAFQSSYYDHSTLTTGQGIWTQRLGLLSLLARDGAPAPGTPSNVNFAGLGGLVLNDSGRAAFKAGLVGEGVDLSNDEGIWSEGPGLLTLIARQGDQAPGMPAGMKYDVFASPRINEYGHIAFSAFISGNGAFGHGVWAETPAGLSLVAGSETAAPGVPSGATFTGFSDPAFNNFGHTAFWAYLAGPAQNEPHDDGIWSNGSGSLELVARRGNHAPGTPAGVNFGNLQLTTFDLPVLNDSGRIAFRAFISGPGIDGSNDEGIWTGKAGDLALLARTGSHAPGTPAGVNFESFFPWNGALQMNSVGQTVFTASYNDDAMTGENGIGIWATDAAGELHLIARTGDSLKVASGDIRTITDLSFVLNESGGSDGHPSGVNDRGQIVFWAKFAGGDEGIFVSNRVAVPEPSSMSLLAFGVFALAGRRIRRTKTLGVLATISMATLAHSAPRYIVTDLGVAGAENTLGWGINSMGQVTGYAGSAEVDTITGFVWNPTTTNSATGALHRWSTLGGSFSWGIGINASGQIAGLSATNDDEAEHATLWNPSTPNGSTGTLHDLSTLGGTYSQGTGINNSGLLTGYSDLTGDEQSHAILWKPTAPGSTSGAMHDLDTLGGSVSFGWDINTNGHVTGDSTTTGDAATHAFLWRPATPNGVIGSMNDLETLGGTDSGGSGINDLGQVTGWSLTTDDEATHAFLWTPTTPGGASGTMLDLGALGDSDSYGYNINAVGQVVGLSYVPAEVSSNSHAFLYTSDVGMVDLNTQIDPLSGWELLDASDINDVGQITGQGLINGEFHAYLLTPLLLLPGDFNEDNVVDEADLAAWRLGFGFSGEATHAQGDADGDRDVDGADFLTWQRQLGTSQVAKFTAAVPEPRAFVLAVLCTAAIALVGQRLLALPRKRRVL